MSTSQIPAAVPSASQRNSDLKRRLLAEFAEMPGLRLTLPQASRLFNLEPAQCQDVLSELVRSGELSREGQVFVRAGAGRQWH